MASVQVNGITIEYEEQGSGTPLLLVMGLGGQLIDWPQPLVDRFADAGFRVIRFDNRDIGLSTEIDAEPPTRGDLVKSLIFRRPIDATYDLSDMAADAFGLLDALGIDGVHVVGMSMGGMIAQQMAIDTPDRVRSLTSIMSTTGNPKVGRPTPKVMRKSAKRPATDPDSALEAAVEFFRDISGPGFDDAEFREVARIGIARSWRPEGTARQLAAIIASGDRTPHLERLDVPTLVVHGLVDTLVRPSGGIATARAIPGSRLLMFNDMGHDFPPARYDEIVAATVTNTRRAERREHAAVS